MWQKNLAKLILKEGLVMISFNVPPYVGGELDCIGNVINNHKICGDGEYTKKCSAFLEKETNTYRVLLTTSGTHALEMAARLCSIKSGDEVIMPSFTFSSTANAFVQMGARIAFIDIEPKTMNMDAKLIEAAINKNTRAIVPVHYAGIACDMETILQIAKAYHLLVVEDAAQAVNASYKGKALGTFGNYGCYSFHETKNYSMGEGGAILINNQTDLERAEILREKGTNRSKFFRGQIDKYSWVDYGSSYLPSELNAAYLYAQLEKFEEINDNRLASWNLYFNGLEKLAQVGHIELPFVPDGCKHNAHMFYIKAKDLEERTQLITFLKEKGIASAFHYVPLHSAPAGRRFGKFIGNDKYTTSESNKLLRLPMYYGLTKEDIYTVISVIYDFYKTKY